MVQTKFFEDIPDNVLVNCSEEMKRSYLRYAMSVIIGRALPDARDGLKPVQRRVLYSMQELGLKSSQPHKKSARIVGEAMGKYHPHGDTAIYDAMARMCQDFSMNYPLVDGHGNFGSIDGDSPAAMRYTEARLGKLGEEMLSDIQEGTIDWTPNFDESLKEPTVLPARFPNLIVNGTSGIAVGMTTNILPHNLGETIDACCLLIDKPESELKQILKVLPGPDFPTGGVCEINGIEEAYRTGKGKIVLKGKVSVENRKNGKNAIIITEIPYMVNKSTLIESIGKCASNKIIEGISDLRDESDRTGIRIVLELQKGIDPEKIIEKLYVKTQLQTNVSIIHLAVVEGQAKELGIKELLEIFLEHRRDIVRRRTEYRLKRAEEKLHITEGLIVAQKNIDEIVALIKASSDGADAKKRLETNYALSETQAQAILDMRLQRLSRLELKKLETEKKETKAEISQYKNILKTPKDLDNIVKTELLEVKKNYGRDRRTVIVS